MPALWLRGGWVQRRERYANRAALQCQPGVWVCVCVCAWVQWCVWVQTSLCSRAHMLLFHLLCRQVRLCVHKFFLTGFRRAPCLLAGACLCVSPSWSLTPFTWAVLSQWKGSCRWKKKGLWTASLHHQPQLLLTQAPRNLLHGFTPFLNQPTAQRSSLKKKRPSRPRGPEDSIFVLGIGMVLSGDWVVSLARQSEAAREKRWFKPVILIL